MLPAPTVPFVDPLFFMSKESTKTSLTSRLVVFFIDPTNLYTIAKPVRFMDSRLPNKQEIVALLIEGQSFAYDTDFLKKNPLYQDHLENRQKDSLPSNFLVRLVRSISQYITRSLKIKKASGNDVLYSNTDCFPSKMTQYLPLS